MYKLIICENTTGIVLNMELEYNHGSYKPIEISSIEDAKTIISCLIKLDKEDIYYAVYDQNGEEVYSHVN